MGARGIDIAWARPTVAEIKATGARWVARYFSKDPTKNLRASEVHAYQAAGLGIVVVYETSTTEAERGFQAGRADALAAEAQRRGVGLPNDMPLHFAVDTDTDWAHVARYFDGVMSVIGKARTGIYGGVRVAEGAHAAGIPFIWQADAWSYGRWCPAATIRQTGGTCLGGSADYDTAMAADFGQYPRPTGDTLVATQAEITAIAKASAAETAALLTDGPHRDTLAAANLYWLQRALDPTIPLDAKGGWPATQTLAVRKVVVAREAALTAAIEALSKAVGAGGLTAAQIQEAAQAGATAALKELGQTLDGIKPPAPAAATPADSGWGAAPVGATSTNAAPAPTAQAAAPAVAAATAPAPAAPVPPAVAAEPPKTA